MCMSIEYHLYLLHFFYHVNDYNLFIIFVLTFMGGSMSKTSESKRKQGTPIELIPLTKERERDV